MFASDIRALCQRVTCSTDTVPCALALKRDLRLLCLCRTDVTKEELSRSSLDTSYARVINGNCHDIEQ